MHQVEVIQGKGCNFSMVTQNESCGLNCSKVDLEEFENAQVIVSSINFQL